MTSDHLREARRILADDWRDRHQPDEDPTRTLSREEGVRLYLIRAQNTRLVGSPPPQPVPVPWQWFALLGALLTIGATVVVLVFTNTI